MKRFAALGLFLLVSCDREEPALKLESLQLPAVMLFSSSSIRVCKEGGELTNIHTNYLTLNQDAPSLIDSDFKIYSLDHFQSTHGGLWLMAHPSGMTEVTFEMSRRKSGREEARELFVEQLEKQTWVRDLDERRKALAQKQTLLEMAELLQNTEH